MVNFGYPYNDKVICKDSTDYLHVNDQLVINCNDSRRPCIMLVIVWHEYSMLNHIFNKDDIFFFKNKN